LAIIPNLTLEPAATSSIGTAMFVFPPTLPRLDLIEVAGQSIAPGTQQAVTVVLAQGTDSNQTVVVQATDFQGLVPFDVVLSPEHGARTTYNTNVNMMGSNVATQTVNVVFTVNEATVVHAWTR
jgi:hypothetical protein